MRSKVIVMALLAFALGGTEAAPVSGERVASLVRAWASSKATMGEKFASSAVRLTKEHRTPGGVKFYTVHLADGGVAMTSADTEIEPIIAFTSASEIEESDQNPLWVLINRDIEVRHAALELTKSPVKMAAATAAGVSATALTASVTKMATAAERKWAAFLADGPVVPLPTSAFSAPTAAAPNRRNTMADSDVYVSPLVKTKWSQGEARGRPCYNRFTPENYVCGCTATATAQLMRFFAFPAGEVPAGTRTCKVDGVKRQLGYGGYAYKWDLMPDVPENVDYNEEAWDEIGHLTRDAGVLLESTYTSGAGSAFVQDIPGVLKAYGYKNAVCYYDYATESGALGPGGDGRVHGDTGLHNATTRRNVILSNLDAGLPVVLGIQGYTLGHVGDDSYQAGHAIVADGYGFVDVEGDQTEYIHLNMGWAGADDAWYNTPEIMTDETGAHAADTGFDFTVLSAAAYNVFTNATGEVLSGRVTYEDGRPAAGIIVSAGGKETVTGAGGTYGLILPANGRYDVSARSADGTYEGEVKGVRLGWSAYNDHSGTAQTGNRWGNTIRISATAFEGSVRIARTQEKFGALDAALDAAGDGDTVEILSQTVLRFPQSIAKDVTIRTAGDVDPDTAFVICRDRARNGFTNVTAALTLENVKFLNTEGCFVNVAPGGKLKVSGRIGLDGGKDGDTFVRTESEDNLVLAGALSDDTFITIDCAGAKARHEAFGTFTCDDASAEASASHFLNSYDPELGGIAKTDGSKQLVWDNIPVDPGRAIACVGDDYYLTLHKAFADHRDGDVVILRDCVGTPVRDNRLQETVEITGAVRILCTNVTAATVGFVEDASFVIGTGGSLVVSNVVVSGAVGEGAFVIHGGALTLDAGAEIRDCVNSQDEYQRDELPITAPAGAVSVLCDADDSPGTLTMLPGSLICNCSTEAQGGGVYVDLGCTLDMRGGAIEGCMSKGQGGGVYEDWYPGYPTRVAVSGDARITGNGSDAHPAADNLYLYTDDVLELVGELAETARIDLRWCVDADPENGVPFGFVAEACGDLAASNSAVFFRSDEDPENWHGAFAEVEGERRLVWSDAYEPLPVPPPEYVVARVIYDETDGTATTNEFASLDEAFASIRTNATVEINSVGFPEDDAIYQLPNDVIGRILNSVPRLSSSVVIAHDVIVRTEANADDFVNIICRENEGVSFTVRNGAKLTLRDVILDGESPTLETLDLEDGTGLLCCTGWSPQGFGSMVEVAAGGDLVMETDSVIEFVEGRDYRDSAAVSVHDGTFTMKTGAYVVNCVSSWAEDPAQAAPAGGVIVDGRRGLFVMEGGEVSECAGMKGGGVFIGNEARIEISGDSYIHDNEMEQLPEGSTVSAADLSVSREVDGTQNGHLVLTGEFTGWIGVREPRIFEPEQDVETNEFGTVEVAAGDLAALLPSAANFFRNVASGVTGLIVTNDTEALLVWSSAVDEDGIYRDRNGDEYKVVEDRPDPPPPTEIDPPTAVTGLIYNGNEQTGVVASVGFTLTGNVGTNAGSYTAKATLDEGYVWAGGSTVVKEISWKIGLATYDMSGASFDDAEYVEDGTPKSIYVSGTLPAGVDVAYEGNGQTLPGTYTVTAKFTGDAINYNTLTNWTAHLTITAKEEPQEYTVETNAPTQIAFSEITRVSDTKWRIVVTDLVEQAEYAVSYTPDLKAAFTTDTWFRATSGGAWTNTVEKTEPAYFWRAHGRTTYTTNWTNQSK